MDIAEAAQRTIRINAVNDALCCLHPKVKENACTPVIFEFDREGVVCNWTAMPDQLVEPIIFDDSVSLSVRINSMIHWGSVSVDCLTEADRLSVA